VKVKPSTTALAKRKVAMVFIILSFSLFITALLITPPGTESLRVFANVIFDPGPTQNAVGPISRSSGRGPG
jgi:hypothetical protein